MSDLVTAALGWSGAELRRRYRAGGPVAPRDLAGRAFRGISLGLPPLVERLSWKTFAKVFVADGARVRGFNLRIVQNGDIAGPYRPRPARARFGEMEARAAGGRTVLDYAAANPWWHPLARARDTLVRLDGEHLLGRAQLAIAGREIETPSFFVLTGAAALPDRATIDDADRYLDVI